MKTRLIPSLILVAVFSASCAPATATVNPAPTAVPPTATLNVDEGTPPVPTLDQGQPVPGVTEAPTQAPAPTAIPVATSRGPDLHATDPTTVNLASGQIQFVEFFRFT